MKTVFLDSSYLIALEVKRDQDHEQARDHWESISSSIPRMLTTSFVFDEVVTSLNSDGYHDKAVEIGTFLLSSKSVRFLPVGKQLFEAGWTYLQQHPDKNYSLTDCISFVVMERRKISTAFTFDHHFVQAGFQTEP